MRQNEMLQFVCDTALVAYRFVTITPSTGKVVYTTAGEQPDAVTLADSDNGVVSVHMLQDLSKSFFFEAGGSITAGQYVQVGASGVGVVYSTGKIACIAKTSCTTGSTGTGYINNILPLGDVGTPAAGVTADESSSVGYHRSVLTVSTALGAIAGGANLALGKLMYTFPAGIRYIRSSYISMALNTAGANIPADTPDVGLGTVLGAGVHATLSAAGATMENILTGQTAADCNGTPTVATVTNQALLILAADAHTIYFNVADGWAAGGDAACPIAGTIIIEWA
jgi:hypothetical protein